jgi:hypothetical protein
LVFFVCLLPLALYCLFLAWLNGSRRTWIISGGWDFAGILFAVSGLLLAGGPAILTGISEDWRAFWIGSFPGRPWAHLASESPTNGYLFLGVAYIGLVVLISGVTLWRRRFTTMLYNLDAAAFEAVLAQVMEGMGLTWVRSGNLICWQQQAVPKPNAEDPRNSPTRRLADTAIQLSPATSHGQSEPATVAMRDLGQTTAVTQTLRVELSPTLRYACLHWSTIDGWPRQALEAELNRHRVQLHAQENPLSFWLLLVATLFVFGIFIGMLTMLIFSIVASRAG